VKSKKEIKATARETVAKQRIIAITTLLLLSAITYLGGLPNFLFPQLALTGLISLVTLLFVDTVLIANSSAVFAKIYREEQTSAKEILSGFKVNYFGKVGGMLLIYLFTFLWSLLLIVPGIIKGISYFMTPYILAEYPKVKPRDAINLSRKMTYGYKMKLFVASLSFIGWGLLHVLIFIGLSIPVTFLFSGDSFGMEITETLLAIIVFSVWYFPYIMATFSGYYNELLNKALADGTIALADGTISEVAKPTTTPKPTISLGAGTYSMPCYKCGETYMKDSKGGLCKNCGEAFERLVEEDRKLREEENRKFKEEEDRKFREAHMNPEQLHKKAEHLLNQERKPQEALKLFRQAAAAGYAYSKLMVAIVTPDFNEWVQNMKSLTTSDSGSISSIAQIQLGIAYTGLDYGNPMLKNFEPNEIAAIQNPAEGFKLIEKGLSNHDVHANLYSTDYLSLANVYRNRNKTKDGVTFADQKVAVVFLEKALQVAKSNPYDAPRVPLMEQMINSSNKFLQERREAYQAMDEVVDSDGWKARENELIKQAATVLQVAGFHISYE